jgi:hypothetical protein
MFALCILEAASFSVKCALRRSHLLYHLLFLMMNGFLIKLCSWLPIYYTHGSNGVHQKIKIEFCRDASEDW